MKGPRTEPRARILIQAVALAALVWAVYWNSLHNPFQFDDWHVIPQNPAVRGPADVPSFFVDASAFSILPGNRDYRPVFLTSMALCWWLGEGSTLPFHVVSVALHMGNVLLLFFIFRRISSDLGDPAAGPAPEDAGWAAFLAAALFALHPVASEPINYVSSQSLLWADFFYLVALYAFVAVYDREEPPAGLGKWLTRVGAYAAYALALLSKPIAVTLPLMLLLWELLLGRDRPQTGGKAAGPWKRWRPRLHKHLPFVAITIGYLLLRKAVLPAGGAVGGAAFFNRSMPDLLLHFATQTRAMVLYYLKLALLPGRLNVDLEFRRSTSLAEGEVLLSLAVVAAIAWLLFRARRQRLLVFWSLWFPVGLLVTTYVMVMGQTVREARAYLSLMGFCAVAALLFLKLWWSFPVTVSKLAIGARPGKTILTAAVAIVLILFGAKTRAQNHIWSSGLTLWQSAAARDGTWRAHMNYGVALEATERKDEALAQFKKAVELGPFPYAHLNLGFAYVNRGHREDGLRHLRKAVELWPSSPETHLYLAYGLAQDGQSEAAEKELREALRLRPKGLKALGLLAELYERQGRVTEALAHYERLVEVDPGQTLARERIRRLKPLALASELNDRGVASFRKGDYEAAIRDLDRAIELNPGVAFYYNNRGSAYSNQGLFDRAIEDFDKAIELDPSYVNAYNNRAIAYTNLAQYEPAIRDFDRTLELDPGYTSAYNHRGLAHRSLGDYDRAIRDFNRAIELDPNDASAYYNRALAYGRKADYAPATRDGETALRLAQQRGDAGLIEQIRHLLGALEAKRRSQGSE